MKIKYCIHGVKETEECVDCGGFGWILFSEKECGEWTPTGPCVVRPQKVRNVIGILASGI